MLRNLGKFAEREVTLNPLPQTAIAQDAVQPV
jgi:hypothetical protein